MIFGEGPVIKNIAGDLNKLFLQGTRAGQPINNVEGDAAADQGTVQLMADRDPVIRDISTGLGWAGREVTVSGTGALQLVNSLGRPLKSWSVDVLPYQEGTGDPAPDNVRPIHGTDKLNLFVADSYDPTATPTAVIDVPTLSANQWDEEWEVGAYDTYNGQPISLTDRIRCKNYIDVLPSTAYYFVMPSSASGNVFYYDNNKKFISGKFVYAGVFTTPSNCKYLRMAMQPNYGLSYNHDIAINYPSTVTTYNPYSNTIYTATIGDDGGESRYAAVDLGTLDWQYRGEIGAGIFSTTDITDYVRGTLNIFAMCETYKNIGGVGGVRDMIGKSDSVGFYTGSNSSAVYIVDERFTDAIAFKAAVTGIKLVYELATPTTLTITTPPIPTIKGTATTWATAEDGIVTSFSATYLQSE